MKQLLKDLNKDLKVVIRDLSFLKGEALYIAIEDKNYLILDVSLSEEEKIKYINKFK